MDEPFLPSKASALLSDPVAAFAVFARHMNFTHAAKELNIAQPSLNVKIRKLADQLGTSLYVKDNKTLHLTPDGERLVQFAQDAERLAQQTLVALGGSASRRMVLAAGRGGYLYVIAETIKRLTSRLGGLKFITAQNSEAIQAVNRGEADLAVIAFDTPPEHLNFRLLDEYSQALVTRSDHPLASRKRVEVKELDGIELVLPERAMEMRKYLTRTFAANDVDATVAAEALNWDLLVQFVTYGIEATIVNEFVPVPAGYTKTPIVDLRKAPYYAIWRPERRSDAEEFLAAHNTK